MPLSSYTLVALIRRLAREVGAIVAEGVAASVTTTTIVDTVNMQFPNDSDFNGFQVFIVVAGGTEAVGSTRWITASTTATKTITIPTLTGLSGTPTYVVLNTAVATYDQLADAIRSAVESVVGFHLPVKMNARLITNDLLQGEGDVEIWTAGTSSAPDGWVLAGTGAAVARTAAVGSTWSPHDGADFEVQYAAQLTNGASAVASLTWRPYAQRFGGYDGQGFKFLAEVLVSTAARVFLRLSDGTTNTDSSNHGGSGNFTELSAEATLANPTGDLAASLQIATGGAITATMDHSRLIAGSYNIYDYILPPSFTAISEVWMESSTPFDFRYKLPDNGWDVFKGASNDRIRFRPGVVPWTADRRLLLIGNADLTIPSAAADNIDINPEYVLAYAKSKIADLNKDASAAARWYAIATDLRGKLSTGVLPNSKFIEPL